LNSNLPSVILTSVSIGMSHVAANRATLEKYTLRRTPWRPFVTSFYDIYHHKYEGNGTAEDPYLVGWLFENDHENPQTYSQLYKWMVMVFVSLASLAVTLSSSAYTGAITSIQEDFGGSTLVLTLGLSLFVLGFAFGPLLWAPFSEIVGRRYLFVFTFAFYTLWSAVTVASPNLQSIIIFRFLAGTFGSSPLANAGGTIADVFSANQRGLAMAVFASAPFMGPALGPISGGFIGEDAGWQWVMAFLAIFTGFIFLLGALIFPETYAPVLLRRRAVLLSQVTGKHYICRMDKGKEVSLKKEFFVATVRPWLLLCYEPIVAILSLYIAVAYGTMYSFFAAFPIVYQQLRGWSPGIGGLAFLCLLCGMAGALIYIIVYENPRYVRAAAKLPGGRAPPEERLHPALIGAPLLVIGLAWFAGTDSPNLPWIVSILAGIPFGAGMVLIFLSILNYLVDSYVVYAASVLAANSIIRSIFGAAFPLFTSYMYSPVNCPLASCGVHVGAAIACALSLVLLPAPFVFKRVGHRIRAKCRYASEAATMLQAMTQIEKVDKMSSDFPSNPELDTPSS